MIKNKVYIQIDTRRQYTAKFPGMGEIFTGPACYEKSTGEQLVLPERDGVCSPMMILHDITGHVAPSGRWVSGRAAQRDECARSGLVPYERINDFPGGLTSEKFAKKRGLKTDEASQEWISNKLAETATAAGMKMDNGKLVSL